MKTTEPTITGHKVVSREVWIVARKELLSKENNSRKCAINWPLSAAPGISISKLHACWPSGHHGWRSYPCSAYMSRF
jgi:hypothetical protein